MLILASVPIDILIAMVALLPASILSWESVRESRMEKMDKDMRQAVMVLIVVVLFVLGLHVGQFLSLGGF